MTSSDTQPSITVRDAAERLGVTPRTLKYYEERGLVVPQRSDGRYRLYSEEDLARMARILRLRSLGFSLQGIAEMLKRPVETLDDGSTIYADASLREISQGLSEQIAALDARIAAARKELKEAEALRTELNDDLDYVNERLSGQSQDAMRGKRILARSKRAAGEGQEN